MFSIFHFIAFTYCERHVTTKSIQSLNDQVHSELESASEEGKTNGRDLGMNFVGDNSSDLIEHKSFAKRVSKKKNDDDSSNSNDNTENSKSDDSDDDDN